MSWFYGHDDMFSGFGYSRGFGGGFGGYDDGVDRSGFAAVSQSALSAGDRAETAAHEWLMRVDCSAGKVKEEVIDFHLVTAVRKSVGKKLRAQGFEVSFRQISREEQDKFNKTRKSLCHFGSLAITQAAKDKWIAANPGKAASLLRRIEEHKAAVAEKEKNKSRVAMGKRDANEMAAAGGSGAQPAAKKVKV